MTQKHNSKEIILPQINNPKFAEFYGIMLGDGCLYSNLYGICISGHKILDEEYHVKYLNQLSIELFGIKPKIYYSKKTKSIRTVIYSKRVALFLNKIGFPKGLKKEHNFIPKIYLENKNLTKCLIRGLYDTDGTIYPHKGAKVIIEISIKDQQFLNQIKYLADQLNLELKLSTDRVYLSGKDKAINFFIEVKPSNIKHKIKFIYLLFNQKIPSSNEMEMYLKRS
jgi:DNA-binding transcriptional regulator WhiA